MAYHRRAPRVDTQSIHDQRRSPLAVERRPLLGRKAFGQDVGRDSQVVRQSVDRNVAGPQHPRQRARLLVEVRDAERVCDAPAPAHGCRRPPVQPAGSLSVTAFC